MERIENGWTLAQLAKVLGGTLDGPAEKRILRAAPASSNDGSALAFAQSPAFVEVAQQSGVGAILIPVDAPPVSMPAIRVDRPRECFGRFLALCDRPLPLGAGVHPTAIVSPAATISGSARVGAYAVIEEGAVVEDGARIYPFVYVGENCRVGANAILYPHAVLYREVSVGQSSIVHAGAVLGADGFSFMWDGTRQVKIPQVGRVGVGANVEVGALTAIDRATAGDTLVGEGTKLDNFIQVGHNSVIGKHTVIASQTGIAGSTTIGDRVTIAGQVGTSDHVIIGDDVILAGRTGVAKDVLKPGAYWGTPATPVIEWTRILACQRRLPELTQKVKELERRVNALLEKI